MTEDAQILIARLLAHQTLKREDKLVKRALSDENFRSDVDARLKACGMKFVDNVYADYVTLALTRDTESKVFGTKDTWQNNNFGLARDGVALLVVLWSLIILPKRERQEAHQLAQEDQTDMFGKDKPMPRAEETSIGISYRTLLADFGEKLGKKTRMDMNLGQLARLGFIERKTDLIMEGPLLDLLMDTDALKDRIINGALSDIFHITMPRTPATLEVSASEAEQEEVTTSAAVVDKVESEEEIASVTVEANASEDPSTENIQETGETDGAADTPNTSAQN
ncbi:hypothetical protein RF679_03865 [Undibacterium cyanobacteriorum]|uniref:DUF4194 domain-containing protein n=1 Tax=Undibacterium cyanobacteriorum TaxID=3073561 RepID=A0ABY9RKQ8_9BURK|nr:hypothetical protein [Undibacterium sp. 20NA77.5]WMW81424.1 hypothetical protein RF679_03865 [Undibacterium sp. 20NA77.5]